MYQLIFIDMARVGILSYYHWQKVKSPYLTSRWVDDEEFCESIRMVESGYYFIWSRKFREITFVVMKGNARFYLGNDFGSAIIKDPNQCIEVTCPDAVRAAYRVFID